MLSMDTNTLFIKTLYTSFSIKETTEKENETRKYKGTHRVTSVSVQEQMTTSENLERESGYG